MTKPLNFDLKRFRADFGLDRKTLADLTDLNWWTVRKAEKFDQLSDADRKKIHIALVNTFAGRRRIPINSQYSAAEVESAFFLVYPEHRLGRDRNAIDLKTEVTVVRNIGYVLAWAIDIILTSQLGKFSLRGLDALRSYTIQYLHSMIATETEQFIQISCFREDFGVSAEYFYRLSCLSHIKPDRKELEKSLNRFLYPEDQSVVELVHRQSKKGDALPIIGYRLREELANRASHPKPVIRNINLWFRNRGEHECQVQVSSYPQFHNGICLVADSHPESDYSRIR